MNKNKPFITVMVLCYNYGHLLSRALEAIAVQQFRDFELLFIDNGSIDNSKEVFQAFCSAHPEVNARYMLVSPNQGPTHGWNLGLQQARGEYVMFNDADDWMEPNCLQILADAAKRTGADRVAGQYQEVLPDGTVQRIRHFKANKASRIISPMIQGVIFRLGTILSNGIFLPEDMIGPYDAYLTFRFAGVESTNPIFIPVTIYNYLINPASICRTFEKQQDKREGSFILYNKFHKPLIDAAAQCMPYVASRKEVYEQMVYLTLRNSYAAIVEGYKHYDPLAADRLYSYLKNDLTVTFPNYRNNPYIMPIGNGFEFSGSLAVWGLITAEKLGLAKVLLKLQASLPHYVNRGKKHA